MDIGPNWAAFRLQGMRRTQDDRFRVFQAGDWLCALVCDGHGPCGARAAEIACELIPDCLAARGFTGGDAEPHVVEAFRACDEVIAGAMDAGTTASLFAVRSGQACLAWVGDSPILGLTPRGFIHHLTHSHTLQRPEERRRLEAHGARFFNHHRLYSPFREHRTIGTTRSLGDPAYGDLLSPVPEVLICRNVSALRRVFLATDGLVSATDNALVSNTMLATWMNGEEIAASVCELQQRIEALEPSDNTTLLGVDLADFHVR